MSQNTERYILAFIIGMLSIAGLGWVMYQERRRREEAEGSSDIDRALAGVGSEFQAARREMGI